MTSRGENECHVREKVSLWTEVDKKPDLIVSEIMLGCNIVYTFLLELKKLLLAPVGANGIKKMKKTQDVV